MIHPGHAKEARAALQASTGGFLILLLILFWPVAGSARGINDYLALHILLETLAVVVSLLIFAVIWSSRKESLPCNLVLIAITFLGTGILDFSHMLSYAGMPDFVTGSGPEKAINFWLAARLLSALGLLAVAFHSWKTTLRLRRSSYMLLAMLGLLAFLHWLFLLHADWLPSTFVAGSGLTTIKIASEYLIIVLLLLAAGRFFIHLRTARQFNAAGLLGATLLLAQGEFFFTLYADVTDHFNLAGHLFKIAGYYLLYRAVFVETVHRPYELLHASRSQLDATLSALPDQLFEMDASGRYLHSYTTDTCRLAQEPSQLVGHRVDEVMNAEAARCMHEALAEANRTGTSRGRTLRIDTLDGNSLWFEVSVTLYKQARADRPASFLVISRDVSERVAAQQSLHTLSHAIEQNPLAIMLLDENMRILQVNPAFTRQSSYDAGEVLGRTPNFLHAPDLPPQMEAELEQQLRKGIPWSGEIRCQGKDARPYTVLSRIFPVLNVLGEVSGYLCIDEDITEKIEFAARLERLSHHDPLTGLPNRKLLEQQFVSLTDLHGNIHVLWIDLDNFKEVNDALGHTTGDLLLQQVSYRLRDNLLRNEVLARISGDDFVILIPDTGQTDIALRTRQLLDLLNKPLILPRQTLSISASAGIALYPADSLQLSDLLQKAELGKYKAKALGRNNYQFFEGHMQDKALLRLAQSNALKHAIRNDELFMVYQPQISLDDKRMTGVEALLRWRTPEWGLVSPMDFIPLAESSGLILPISEWVLKTCLWQLRSWLDAGLAPFSMAVNISASQFEQPDFVEQIKALLLTTGVPPHLLDLELTEAVAMKRPDLSEARIRQLHELGVRLSIDDFGTGYSSLSYLKRFKIDKLKIDREFIREMDHNHDDQAITSAVIQMAQELSITTLAEGVETARQLELLQQFGCELVQGYYFSKPLPADELACFLDSHTTRYPAKSL